MIPRDEGMSIGKMGPECFGGVEKPASFAHRAGNKIAGTTVGATNASR